jgi:signal transduction histidine kinase
MNDQVGLAGSYSNLGNVYRQSKNYDLAKTYYLRSITILRTVQDFEYLSSTLNNLGNLLVLTGNAKQAIPYLEEGIRIREKNTDQKALASSYVNMADAYNQLKDHQKEELFLNKALAISTQLSGMREVAVLKLKAANAYAANGKTTDAIKLYQQHISLNDSLLNIDVVSKVAEMETKYDTEKKDAQNKLLQQENEIQELVIKQKEIQVVLLIGALILSLVIGLYVYTQYKRKKERELNAALIKEEKRRLAAIISAQEEERKRISGELHDGIGQMLSVVKMNLSAMEEEIPLQQLKQSIQLLDESCSELRNISHHLMPAVLMKKGLVNAIQEFCDNINISKKLHISFYADEFKRVHGSIEINLYRIIQELVQNIVKYAQATEVNLNINNENDVLKLMVSDNGIGLNTEEIKNSNGNGWSNIYSRTGLLNAQIEIDSSPGNGTTIFIDVPLTSKEEPKLEPVLVN